MTVPVDPPADRSGHPDLDALADLEAGLLAGDAAAAARSHLASCAKCAAQVQALRGVTTLLAATAEVGPMPADVADRLHAALASVAPPTAEPARPVAEPPAAPATTTVTPLPTRAAAQERSPLSMRILQAAAVVVLLLGGIGVVLSAIQNTGGGDAGTTSAESGAEGGAAVPKAAESGAYPVTASGRNWSAETVVDAVPEIVAGTVGPPAPSVPAERGAPGDTSGQGDDRELTSAERLASGAELARCVGNLNLGPVTPLAVDLARWEGNPAAVIVLPTPDDPSTADLFVVTPACPPGEFLYFARVPRP